MTNEKTTEEEIFEEMMATLAGANEKSSEKMEIPREEMLNKIKDRLNNSTHPELMAAFKEGILMLADLVFQNYSMIIERTQELAPRLLRAQEQFTTFVEKIIPAIENNLHTITHRIAKLEKIIGETQK